MHVGVVHDPTLMTFEKKIIWSRDVLVPVRGTKGSRDAVVEERRREKLFLRSIQGIWIFERVR